MWLEEKLIGISIHGEKSIKKAFFQGIDHPDYGHLDGFGSLRMYAAGNKSKVKAMEDKGRIGSKIGGSVLKSTNLSGLETDLEKAAAAAIKLSQESLISGQTFETSSIENDPGFRSLAETGNTVSGLRSDFHEDELTRKLEEKGSRRRDFIWAEKGSGKPEEYGVDRSHRRVSFLLYSPDCFNRVKNIDRPNANFYGYIVKEKYRTEKGISPEALNAIIVFNY